MKAQRVENLSLCDGTNLKLLVNDLVKQEIDISTVTIRMDYDSCHCDQCQYSEPTYSDIRVEWPIK